MGRRCLILSGKWQFKNTVRRTLGYPQSREHIWLVAQAGYSMMTFPMKWPNSRQDEDGNGPPVIDDVTPVLSTRGLLQTGNDWYATDLTQDEGEIRLAEEREAPERYPEGARKQICVNAIEQSRQARDACIEHHGLDCVA